jgi:hypothetical protein
LQQLPPPSLDRRRCRHESAATRLPPTPLNRRQSAAARPLPSLHCCAVAITFFFTYFVCYITVTGHISGRFVVS